MMTIMKIPHLSSFLMVVVDRHSHSMQPAYHHIASVVRSGRHAERITSDPALVTSFHLFMAEAMSHCLRRIESGC